MPRNEVVTEIDGRRLTLSNLDKILYPLQGITKGEVIDYYLNTAEVLLPHLADKALTRIRFPDGVAGGSFFEKNRPAGCPDWVSTLPVQTSEGVIDYVVADQRATLILLANLASLELHVPQWRGGSAAARPVTVHGDARDEHEPLAQTLVVDLDPGPELAVPELCRAAQLVGGLLVTEGLTPLVRSTGSKGLQVYAAVAPTAPRAVTAYAQRLSQQLVAAEPELFTGSISLSKRPRRVYLDHNQNLAARNTIAPYSLRGREQINVSTPLEWDEVAAATSREDLVFTPAAVLERLDELGDLFAELVDPVDAPALPEGPG